MRFGRILWVLFLFCGTLFLKPQPVPALSRDALIKRLDELSATIQEQQKEIERLKKELKNQQQSVDSLKADHQEGAEKTAKAETAKEEESSWREWLPKWVQQIRISGDLRLRYERIWDRHMLTEAGSDAKQDPRDRGRLRARLFFDADITDEIATHFMVATNMDSHQEATTTNQTFTADFNDKGIYLHRAYVEYDPKWLDRLML